MMQDNAPADSADHFNNGGIELDLMDAPRSPSQNVSLEFQEIAHTGGARGDDFRDSASLLHPDSGSSSLPLPGGVSDAAPAPVRNPNASFYQLAYYQGYFDVTTSQIVSRLLRALMPFRGKFYRDDDGVGGGPDQADLYGPFWICTTLIFFLAAAGNFANYLQWINDPNHGPGSAGGSGTMVNGTFVPDPTSSQNLIESGVWTYDFQKVTIGASVFYAWITIVPFAVYCFFKRVGSGAGSDAAAASDAGVAGDVDPVPQKGLVEIASLFGYGLVWLLPVCLICIPPVALVRWVAVGVAWVMSSLFLLINLGTVDVGNKTLLPVIAGILILNFAIAVLTKFYFFDF